MTMMISNGLQAFRWLRVTIRHDEHGVVCTVKLVEPVVEVRLVKINRRTPLVYSLETCPSMTFHIWGNGFAADPNRWKTGPV